MSAETDEGESMKDKRLLVFLFAAALAVPAAAQTKISGTLQCGKPDPSYNIPLTDKPGHVFVIEKSQCTWSKPIEMAGVLTKDGASTAFAEVTGDTVANHGWHMSTLANGDTLTSKFHGSAKSKDGVVQSTQGSWTFTAGTGKLKGLKGKGTYKGMSNADGSITYQIEGEYQLP
jgi:hypothetical protein